MTKTIYERQQKSCRYANGKFIVRVAAFFLWHKLVVNAGILQKRNVGVQDPYRFGMKQGVWFSSGQMKKR